jgi:outer membrane protein assembly factor BamB
MRPFWPTLLPIALVTCVAQAAPLPAEQNWPQWRGPLANGVAPSGNPPTTWSETNNIKWKVKLPGRGTATPIVWDNQIFIQTAIATGRKIESPAGKAALAPQLQVAGAPQTPAEPPRQRRPAGGGGFGRGEQPSEVHQFVLLSIDRQTGRTLWQQTVREEVPHEGAHRDHGFASHSPITDGQHVYSWFGSRGLHCYDLEGGLKWQKEFGQLRTKNSFGEGNSPALSGRTLVVTWDHEGEDFIAAFDKDTGQELWRQSRDESTSWATPFIVQHGGQAQVIASASRKVRSYDLATGKLLWECAGLGSNVIPTPVAGHDMVYVMSGHEGRKLLAIRLGKSGDLTGTDAVAWSLDKSTPYVPSPLIQGDLLFFFSGREGRLSCFDAKLGRPHYESQPLDALPGVYASPVAAGGRIYLTGRNGAAAVIKHSEKLEVLATNRLEDRFDASPAIVGNELILRGHEHLYCIAEK